MALLDPLRDNSRRVRQGADGGAVEPFPWRVGPSALLALGGSMIAVNTIEHNFLHRPASCTVPSRWRRFTPERASLAI
jgi:hypothetical protein